MRSRHTRNVPNYPVGAVCLVGFMGAGKTSVGRALGQRLNWIFEDLDDRIERREGRTVPAIFRDSGEQEFRRAEHDALREILTEAASPRVIALGGGAFVQSNNAALLKKSGVPTIFLDAGVDELWARCAKQATAAGAERPLLRSLEQFRKLYQERRRSYANASMKIQTASRPVDEIVAEIASKLRLKRIEIRIEQGEIE